MEGMFIFTNINSRVVIAEKVGVAERVSSHFFCNKKLSEICLIVEVVLISNEIKLLGKNF
jgi:hypothetical protein